ncbi:MAG: trp operon leader peptide [Streptomyces sp.]|nr:trp operon leader peptide [Streptomyces sp.]NUS84899.1 trp operon leader peptide [Streptomyces sp.]
MWDSAFRVTPARLRGPPSRPAPCPPDETPATPRPSRTTAYAERAERCGRVRAMFARLTMTWWWTAHPAAH